MNDSGYQNFANQLKEYAKKVLGQNSPK